MDKQGGIKLDSGTWIAIYLPIFVLFFIILPHRRRLMQAVKHKMRAKKGEVNMSELLRKYINKNCVVSTGTFGVNVTGVIKEIQDNWIELETKKGKELINCEFIQNIKIKEKK